MSFWCGKGPSFLVVIPMHPQQLAPKISEHCIWYLVSPILIVLPNTNCKPRCIVTKTKCSPNIICHPLCVCVCVCCLFCLFLLGGDYKFKMLQILSLTMTIFHHKLLTREDKFWPMHELIHHPSNFNFSRGNKKSDSYHCPIFYHYIR